MLGCFGCTLSGTAVRPTSASSSTGGEFLAPDGAPLQRLVRCGIRCHGTVIGEAFSMPETAEILTIRKVADFLKIGEKTTYSMAQRGELPGFKVRGQWRLRRIDLDIWVRSQIEAGRPSGPSEAWSSWPKRGQGRR